MFLHWTVNTELWSFSRTFKRKELHKNTKMTTQIAAPLSCFCQWLLIGLDFWSRRKWLSEWVGRASLRAHRSINTNLWGIWARGNMHKLFLSGLPCGRESEDEDRQGKWGWMGDVWASVDITVKACHRWQRLWDKMSSGKKLPHSGQSLSAVIEIYEVGGEREWRRE